MSVWTDWLSAGGTVFSAIAAVAAWNAASKANSLAKNLADQAQDDQRFAEQERYLVLVSRVRADVNELCSLAAKVGNVAASSAVKSGNFGSSRFKLIEDEIREQLHFAESIKRQPIIDDGEVKRIKAENINILRDARVELEGVACEIESRRRQLNDIRDAVIDVSEHANFEVEERRKRIDRLSR